jgi:hypothetical protein
MKALTEAGSLGGSKLNLKGTGWKTDGTSRSMDGGEVASGTECTVISGTRLTPNKSFARVLASSVRLGLARCGGTTSVVVSGARTTDSLWTDSRRGAASCMATVALSPPPAARRVAGQTRMLLFRHRVKTLSSSPPPGELTTVVVAVALRGEEYHVVAAVEGHELETPEAEQRPGLKRSLKTAHLELNGKVFVNTQQAPTWCANCRRFGPGGPSTEPTSEFIAACPCSNGLAQDGTQGEMRLVLSRTGGARSRGYKRRERERERERERACSFARPPARPPSPEGPGPPFYRCKERVQMYNGGCSYALTCPAEKCLSLVYMPTWLSKRCLSPVYVITWPSEKCLSPVEAQLAVRLGSC